MKSAVGSTGLHPRTTAYCNSDGRFAQIASWQYCSMAWPTLLDCRLRELRRNHCATAGQAQTRTYPGQRSSTGSCVPYRFRLDTGPCVGTGGGLAKSGKRDSRFPYPEPPSEVTWHQAHTTAVRRQIRNHGSALLPDGTDPDVGQQTNTDLHRSLLDLRGTRSCAERVLLAFGELRQTNIDLGLAGNARIVANAADPFDTPEQIVIRERINCVNSLAHWQIITESESIKEPRGRSRSQSYSQIALLHSHLFLHDQLTFADISGTDRSICFSMAYLSTGSSVTWR